MELTAHPEAELYVADRRRVVAFHQALASWREQGDSLQGPWDVTWTVERLQAFVLDLQQFFAAYNRVLWEQFSYCRNCGGGCCVVGASQVTTFDALALGLMEQPFPAPTRQASPRDCIYLAAGSCSWPAQWRPLKCWSFYCLGSGDWRLDAAEQEYAAITAALEQVLEQQLPHPLQRYNEAHGELLHRLLFDPISFAQALSQALAVLVVEPFLERFPALRELDGGRTSQAEVGAARDGDAAAALSFIASAVESLWQGAGLGSEFDEEQMLADLEQLEWIVNHAPRNREKWLAPLYRRYGLASPPEAGDAPSLPYQMQQWLQRLLQNAPAAAGSIVPLDDIGVSQSSNRS